jgi:hypothetical protein
MTLKRQSMRSWLKGLSVLSLGIMAGCGAADADVPQDEAAPVQQEALAAGPNKAELARMQGYLDQRYAREDVVHQFRSAAGDDIDCVRIEAQPALRGQGLKREAIQLAPATAPAGDAPAQLGAMSLQGMGNSTDATGKLQRCPEGSVPILRVTMKDLQRFNSLEEYFRKAPGPTAGMDPGVQALGITPSLAGPTALHQYAHGYQFVTNRGATSTFNLWNPAVELSSEFSLSQLWVTRGTGSNLETVEAGVQNYQQLYGDKKTRLFIYYTPNNYVSGCYNLSCGAFVQTSTTYTPGAAFSSYSTAGGTQYEISIEFFKDGTAGHWWLKVGGVWVGYYPRTLFDSYGLINESSNVDFGGEIIDNRNGGRHTTTDMGSGAFPASGYGYAAYQRRIQYINTSNIYTNPSLTLSRDSAYCYDIAQFLDSTAGGWGRYFYFGGTGYNANCT